MSPEIPLSATDRVAGMQPCADPLQVARQPSRSRQFGQGLALLASALLSYYIISHFLVQTVRVVGVSMLPTLQDSQMYLLNRWVLHFRAPKRTEIVVLRDPLDGGFAVKRVIGVAGDSVYLSKGHVYVNGRELQEPYLAGGTQTFLDGTTGHQLFTCKPGQYFVLGDNRGNSLDSRVYGPVSASDILGLLVK